ncbi:MAG: D-alanyl-D-alanine carboxypeptidase [Ruminococcaceae bacterium]|nr:D-alanyl-D-alanine carboxypeptidase [Oscillospiraceae bacterium]
MKKAVSLFFCVLLLTLGILPAFADLSEVVALVPPPDVSKAESVYMYHVDSDTLMLDKNTDTVRYPASTVKIMSGLIACQLACEQLERQITITGQMLAGADGRVMGLEAGEIVTIKDLLYAGFCSGYNDAVSVLAYVLCGSTEEFVAGMNAQAAVLGALQTVYTNPTGLHDNAMVTTAADTAKIALAASENTLFMKITSAVKYRMPPTNRSGERTLHNRNSLVSTYYGIGYFNDLCHGMNAGSTDEGGWCCVTLAERDGDRYLCVVMGADEDENYIYSYKIANELANWACKSFATRQVLEAGQATITIPVENTGLFGLEVEVCAKEDLTVYLPRSASDDDLVVRAHLSQTSLDAPVSAGQVVGVITVYYQDVPLGSVDGVILEDHARNPILHGINLLSDYVTSRAFAASAVCAILLLGGYFLYVYSGISMRPKKGKYKRRR